MQTDIDIPRLEDEVFVLQIDGQTKSSYRRFIDALRAALLLKGRFPHHDIKVRAAESPHQRIMMN